MYLTAASRYALKALASLATQSANGQAAPRASHVIAASAGLPEGFLLKVLRPLVLAGIVTSLKGPHGGYRLAKAAKAVTLLDVVEAVDGPVRGEAAVIDAADGGRLDASLQRTCDGPPCRRERRWRR
jgi:Rrf2 family protein